MMLAEPRIDGTRVTYGDDRGLLVEFIDDAIYQPYESEQKNRAIYKTVPFVSIIFPGDKTKKRYYPARPEDKIRFAYQWAAYEKGQVAVADGTPITEWTYLSKSQALELKHMGFFTVELLANASDTQISNLMEGHKLRAQAKAFIDTSTDGSNVSKLAAEVEQLKAQLKTTLDNMADLKAKASLLENDTVRKPGRPPKLVQGV